jgi:YfiH family protein
MQLKNSNNNLEYYQSSIMDNNLVKNAFFTRNGGASIENFASLDCNIRHTETYDSVEKNLTLIANEFSIPLSNLKIVNQVHSTDVQVVTEVNDITQKTPADALVTNLPNVAIAVYTADCVPIIFSSNDGKVIGVCHAGWKGAINGIIQNTLKSMKTLGAGDIRACIGPAISQNSYEVDQNYRITFLENSPKNKQFFIPSKRENFFMFDLKGFCYDTLLSSGVSKIEDINIDTYSNEAKLFSYRRACHQNEVGVGGQLSAIMINKQSN